MSKRFTETEKWHDPWFRKLLPKYKCFWLYLCDTCNNAGLWTVDFELAEILIGEKIELEDVKRYFQDQIRPLREGKYWVIRDFIRFQYGELSRDSRPHQQVFTLLKKHGVSKEYLKGIHTPKDKDKDKDKDKRGGVGGFSKPSAIQVAEYAAGIGFKIDAEAFVSFYESKGWLVGKTPMQDWKAAIRTWRQRRREETNHGTNGSKSVSSYADISQRYREFRKSEGLRKVAEVPVRKILSGIRNVPVDEAQTTGIQD